MHVSIAELRQYAKDLETTLGTEVHRFVSYVESKWAEKSKDVGGAIVGESIKLEDAVEGAAAEGVKAVDSLVLGIDYGVNFAGAAADTTINATGAAIASDVKQAGQYVGGWLGGSVAVSDANGVGAATAAADTSAVTAAAAATGNDTIEGSGSEAAGDAHDATGGTAAGLPDQSTQVVTGN